MSLFEKFLKAATPLLFELPFGSRGERPKMLNEFCFGSKSIATQGVSNQRTEDLLCPPMTHLEHRLEQRRIDPGRWRRAELFQMVGRREYQVGLSGICC